MKHPAHYQRFFELSPDLLCVAGFDGYFKQVNSAWSKVLGYSERELVKRPYIDFVHPDDVEATLREAAKLTQGIPLVVFENRYRCKDGSYRWLQWTAAPATEEKIIYADARDITEHHDAEERLRNSHEELIQTQLQLVQSEKINSIGRVAAGVAHEVKSPLSILMMGVDYLSKFLDLPNQPIDPSHRAVLDAMRHAISRADVIVRGLVDFSAPHRLELKPHDINKLLENSIMMVKHEMLTHRIDLHRNFASDLPVVQLDETKFEQVMVNLLLNSVQAMPRGGLITIRSSRQTLDANASGFWADRFSAGDTVVIIDVTDTGSGVPPDVLAKVFDPFFTTKPRGKGTGLGLTVARNIVDMHRGTIELNNRPTGGVAVRMMFRAS